MEHGEGNGETGMLKHSGKGDLETENVLGPKRAPLGAASTTNDPVPLCHKFLPFVKQGH